MTGRISLRLSLLYIVLFLCIYGVRSESFQLEEDESNHLGSLDVYQSYDSIDGSQIGEVDVRTKFKRMFGIGIFDDQEAGSQVLDTQLKDVSQTQMISQAVGSYHDYIQLGEWEVQNLRLYPGSVYGFNFSIESKGEDSILAFVSANICQYPASLKSTEALEYLNFYVSSNAGVEKAVFEDGYYQTQNWEYGKNVTLTTLIYIEVKNTTEIDNEEYFQLQFAASTDDLVFQWDEDTFATLVDSDGDSALFRSERFNLTGTTKEAAINGTANFKINVFRDETANYFEGLSKSFCALNSQAGLIPDADINTFYTSSEYDLRKQFVVNNLNASSSYVAYITKGVNGTNDGGSAYSRILFQTAENDACKLIYGLDFCDQVAYSVPQSAAYQLDQNVSALKAVYDSYPKSIYQNFSKAMQQINCFSVEDALYSPIATCDDCRDSYKNWLCAITIPRCGNTNRDEYKLRETGESRNDYLNDVVQPPSEYYEILPCIDMCWSIVQNCPPVFSFTCPRHNNSVIESYQYYKNVDYTTCNLFGNSTAINSGQAIGVNYRLLSFTVVGLLWVFLEF